MTGTVFHVELGDPGAPVLLLVHRWPASSIDWSGVAGPLSERFRVCALDLPGYGFSGKPRQWGYSLTRDAELLEFYLAQVLGAEAAVIVAHDRGDSVALVHAARCAGGRAATPPGHLVLTNGNIFLPLPNLTQAPGRRSRGPGPDGHLRPRRRHRGPARDDPVPGRTLRARAHVADRPRQRPVPRDHDLGPVRHGLTAAGGELGVEPVPDAQARRQPPVLHPGRQSLPAGRPGRRLRQRAPPRPRTRRQPRTRPPRTRTRSPLLADTSREQLPAAADLLRTPQPAPPD